MPNPPEAGTFTWDGVEYDAVAGVQESWGREVIDRDPWRGDEAVLDAGCGSGRLVPFLAAKIPHGRLTCVDRDASMTEAARRRIRELALAVPVDVAVADLADLEQSGLRPASFDVVFSNAALHWVADKRRAFAGFARLLVPGGRLTAQFGGEGNIQRIRAAMYRTERQLGLPAGEEPWHFQKPAETSEQLKICGLREARVWQHAATAEFPDRAAFLRFCSAVILRPYQSRWSAEQWREFLALFPEHAYALAGGWRVDYVRQNAAASK